MTDERMALVELLQKSGDGDFLRSVAEAVLQILMEADIEGLISAGRHECSADRLNPAECVARSHGRYARPALSSRFPAPVLNACPARKDGPGSVTSTPSGTRSIVAGTLPGVE